MTQRSAAEVLVVSVPTSWLPWVFKKLTVCSEGEAPGEDMGRCDARAAVLDAVAAAAAVLDADAPADACVLLERLALLLLAALRLAQDVGLCRL